MTNEQTPGTDYWNLPAEMEDAIDRANLARKDREYAQAKRAAYYKHPADRTSAEQELVTLYVDDLCGSS